MIDVMRCERSVRFSTADDFLSLLPAISRYANRAFRFLDVEARDEAVQEVVAKAFSAYRRLLDRGRGEVIAATPLARYAIAQTKVGRSLGGELNGDDISSRYAQQKHGIEVRSLEHLDEADGTWKSILVEDATATPAEIAAIRVDFQAWLETLPLRLREIAEKLSTGETTQAVAQLFQVTAGRISQIRSQLQRAWEEFQGEEVSLTLA